MLKKMKYWLLLVVCMLALVACSKDDKEKDDGKKEDAEEFVVNDIFEGYKEEGDTIKTVYGVVKVSDYKAMLKAVNSDVMATNSYFESTKKSLLAGVKAEAVTEEFLNTYGSLVGIKSEEELDVYIKNLIKMVNIYNSVWSDIYGCFELVEYNEAAYNALYKESEEYYTEKVKEMGHLGIEDYCEAYGITKKEFENYFYKIEDQIIERIIHIVIAKQQGLEINEETSEVVFKEIAFQNGMKSTEEVKSAFTKDLDFTVANYLVLKWLSENTVVVDDLEAEGVVIDQVAGPQTGDKVASITIKDYGVIKVRLFEKLAPLAVENFETHSKNGYYDGLTFHRVIDNFMIQGGDPNGNGTGGESIWKEPFKDEYSIQLLPIRGALCMANSGNDTNGSQFFIVQSEDKMENYASNWLELGVSEELVKYYRENGGYGSLYKKHTVFGQVYEGYDVLDKIAECETDESDKPVKDVIIEKIEISTY